MTFRSDDEYWAWVDRQIRWREKLYKAVRYAALFAFGTLLVFAMLYFGVRNMGERHYDPWQNAIHNVRSQSG
jgi:hypothetical protein